MVGTWIKRRQQAFEGPVYLSVDKTKSRFADLCRTVVEE
jgi:hypothetical protein